MLSMVPVGGGTPLAAVLARVAVFRAGFFALLFFTFFAVFFFAAFFFAITRAPSL